MKGFMMIMMLLAILVAVYLVAQDMKAKDAGTPSMEVFKKAGAAGEKVNQASEAQEDRLKKILGE